MVNVVLLNTVSRMTHEETEEDAARILAHPKFGKVYEITNTNKPEVLGRPYFRDADDKKVYVDKDESKAEVIVNEAEIPAEPVARDLSKEGE